MRRFILFFFSFPDFVLIGCFVLQNHDSLPAQPGGLHLLSADTGLGLQGMPDGSRCDASSRMIRECGLQGVLSCTFMLIIQAQP